jgi:hypothetical protein
MSDGEEDVWRPPRTPEPWEALTDEEDRVEENTENKDSDLEGAVFRSSLSSSSSADKIGTKTERGTNNLLIEGKMGGKGSGR